MFLEVPSRMRCTRYRNMAQINLGDLYADTSRETKQCLIQGMGLTEQPRYISENVLQASRRRVDTKQSPEISSSRYAYVCNRCAERCADGLVHVVQGFGVDPPPLIALCLFAAVRVPTFGASDLLRLCSGSTLRNHALCRNVHDFCNLQALL